MAKILYMPVIVLAFFLAYTIYSQDLKIKDIREYEKKVVIYSKIKCKFCTEAKQLLNKKDIPYIDIDITWDKELHEKLHKETGHTTVPYIFINQKYIGGYKDLQDLERHKKLDALLKQ